MSVRGPRGRGRGRGRGSGRSKAKIWQWETYTPSPAVYDNIWHVRQAPVTVTPTVPSDCPMPGAHTRILERRQTEDGFGRILYLVEITKDGTEIETIDVSRILQYVSAHELERFENEQFRVEAEAQAVADRIQEEEQIRRRMAKNARLVGSSGRGRGSRMLTGPGVHSELPRPRGRGRGRPRGRSGQHGRGGLGQFFREELPQDEMLDDEPDQALPAILDEMDEISSEEENALPQPASPNFVRSAFVANSALPLSPVQAYQPMQRPALHRSHPEMPDIGGDTDTAPEDSQSTDLKNGHGHSSKRRRTGSMTPHYPLTYLALSHGEESERESDFVLPEPSSTIKAYRTQHDSIDDDTTPRTGHSVLQKPMVEIDEGHDDNGDDEHAEEYVVEAIVEHFHDEEGRKFYLVKWDGYEDSHDWLPEEDLEGAAEAVIDYNERVKQHKGRERAA